MPNATIIADKYAKAIFNIGKKINSGDLFVKDLGVFYNNISDSLEEISNPTISKAQVENIINDLAQKLKINSNITNFLIILAKERRLSLLGHILQKLEKLVKKDKNILQVELISAKQMKEEQLVQTRKLLETKYPKNTIEISEVVKSDILGGIIIKIGSFVIDNSVENQLANLHKECKLAI